MRRRMDRAVALEEAAVAKRRRERLGAVEAGILQGWRLGIHRRCLSLGARGRARLVGEIMSQPILKINR
jgi:hypothetical protein